MPVAVRLMPICVAVALCVGLIWSAGEVRSQLLEWDPELRPPKRDNALTGTNLAERAFGSYARRVVKVRVLQRESVAHSTIGTGFFVTGAGHVMTNYHVVSEKIRHPDRYRVECQTADGTTLSARIVAIDVVHDLAVLESEAAGPDHFMLSDANVDHGARLFSLGHPHDIGLTIVEGTYNGLLEHSLYRRIHFTGSINPGMSGGPTITSGGEVVGINVATAGHQISFLVPVARARMLIEQVQRPSFVPPEDFSTAIREQLLSHQERVFADLLSHRPEAVTMGPYRLPGTLASYFRCWGDQQDKAGARYSVRSHRCATQDQIYLHAELTSGEVRYSHYWLRSQRLNPFRFYTLFSGYFGSSAELPDASPDELTDYECTTDIVEHAARPLKTAFCVRSYRRYAGLYDAVFKFASLGDSHQGVESALTMTGVSFDNALLLSRRYLEAVSWRR